MAWRPSPKATAASAATAAGAHTPAVLLTHGPIDQQLGKIAGLPSVDERRKGFRLLVAVLAVTDERRRERFCSGGCGHWWHNLSIAGA
ncbi:DUF5958 family protein [Streptomyces sp. NPDC000658]|uniref:DUF5958 family protein n=1 Tax=Streptomyces sp. NPDC000658 TaxID=3154266 RepID=UPI00332B7533